jgi:ABC-type molybdate transport system substrate-binding protein
VERIDISDHCGWGLALDAITAALLTEATTLKRVRFAATLLFMLHMSLPIIPFDAVAGDGVVRLYAAGSLRPAFTDIIAAFRKAQAIKVEPTFGGSGLLREELASGEQGDLFASADMGQPLALQAAGKAKPVVLFARNRLCALVRPNLDVTSESLLSTILDPAVRLGTSTPKADPSGDYAWEVFRRADAVQPGSRERLEAKAIKLFATSFQLKLNSSCRTCLSLLTCPIYHW